MSASLAGAMFWLSVAVCLVAQVAILRATLRVSSAATPDATPSLPHPRRWLEMVWVVLPAIALVALFAATWRSIDTPRSDARVFAPAVNAPQPHP